MDLDSLIAGLRAHEPIEERVLMTIMRMTHEVLFEEGTLLDLSLPLTICGDLHGQYWDVLRLFEYGGDPSETRYLFLGDYVDRGFLSVQTIALLFAYKCKYRDSFFLLRGNHESRQVNTLYGFYDEIVERYGYAGPWKVMNDVFDLLPLAAVVGDSIFCVHGGLSRSISVVDQIALLERRQEIPSMGPIADLTWSDPGDVGSWAENPRGCGQLFGEKAVAQFCQLNELELIVRAHQVQLNGYVWHFEGQRLLTIWSAPNYMYRMVNLAAVLKLRDDHGREFCVFEAVEDAARHIPEGRIAQYFV
jgi:diadenosine tetraphosphatase ApaH/serine/threonine PP2A family protein phosphatase